MGETAETAAELVRAHRAGERFRPFAAARGIADLDGAYAVQTEFVGLMRRESGEKAAGYKIGLTSARMQAMCGIDQPIGGVVLAGRVHASGARLSLSRFGRLGLEFEVAVRIGRDLPPGAGPFDAGSIAIAVDAVCPAFELVDDRNADYSQLDVLSLVADNSWNAGIVLGEWRTEWPDLAAIEGTVSRNGEVIDRGHGRDVLGHPFAPLAWIANRLVAQGTGLRAGEIVMTGSMCPTRFPAAGENYRFELAGLGAVETTIAA